MPHSSNSASFEELPEGIEILPDADATRKYTYILQLYETMVERSTDGIYEGKVVDTFASLGISNSYYTELFNVLKELGCIELLDRGTRNRPTRYRLHHAPTVVAYERRYIKPTGGLTAAGKPATVTVTELEQRVSNIERRLSGVDIKQILADYEKRIARLEQQTKGGSK